MHCQQHLPFAIKPYLTHHCAQSHTPKQPKYNPEFHRAMSKRKQSPTSALDTSKSSTSTKVNAKKSNSQTFSKGIAALDDIFQVHDEMKKKRKMMMTKATKEIAPSTRSGQATNVTDGLSCQQQEKQSMPKFNISSRQDLEQVSPNTWVDDGLGGKFNHEGFTGRVEGGVKVFKAHLLNKRNFGQSKDCPFDCDCCFI